MKTAFIDLFSGIGGFALSAYLSGLRFDYHFYSEIEKYSCEVYAKRFPDSIPLGDIKKMQDSTSDYRLRVGDYRVMFDRIERNSIHICEILPRGSAYKKKR